MVAIETNEKRVTPDPRPLDEVLGSRSHVRVLRALIIKDPGENLGLRDVARLAGVSHSRTLKVLRQLMPTGVVIGHKTRRGTIYDLNDDHFLAPQLWTLFDDELHILQGIEGYVRGEARQTRRAVRMRIEPGISTELKVVVTGSGSSHGKTSDGSESWKPGSRGDSGSSCVSRRRIRMSGCCVSSARGPSASSRFPPGRPRGRSTSAGPSP
jgi:hypothetical protein